MELAKEVANLIFGEGQFLSSCNAGLMVATPNDLKVHAKPPSPFATIPFATIPITGNDLLAVWWFVP